MGNNLADKASKKVALTSKVMATLIDPGARSLAKIPNYIPEDLAWVRRQLMTQR